MSDGIMDILYIFTFTIPIASIGSIINYLFIRKYRSNTKLIFANSFFLTSAIIHLESVIIHFSLYTYNIYWITSYLFSLVFAWMVEKLFLENILKVTKPISAKKFILSGILIIICSSIIVAIQVGMQPITLRWKGVYTNFDWIVIVINLLLMTFCMILFFVFAHFTKIKTINYKNKTNLKKMNKYSGEDLSGKEVKKLLRKYCTSDNVLVKFSNINDNLEDKNTIEPLIRNNSIYDVRIDNNTNSICVYIEDKC